MLDKRRAIISAMDDVEEARKLAKGLSETAAAFASIGTESSNAWYMAGRSSLECHAALQKAGECLEALRAWVYAEEPASGEKK